MNQNQQSDATTSEWLPIFRVGTHRSMDGRTLTFGEADLDEMVSLYNGQAEDAKRVAPHVIGHPKNDASSPAHGWVEELKREGDTLFAKTSKLSDELVSLIKDGAYRFRSAAFFPNKLLRHVGWLGATQPAVAGLGDVTFGADGDVAEFAYDDYDWTIEQAFTRVGEVLGAMRDYLIDTAGLDAANKIITTYDVDALKQVKMPMYVPPMPKAADLDDTTNNPLFAEPDDMDPNKKVDEGAPTNVTPQTTTDNGAEFAAKVTNLETMLAASTQENEALRKRVSELESARLRDEVSAFADGLVRDGKILPAEREFVVNDLVLKASMPAFAEGGKTPFETTKEHYASRPANVLTKHVATQDGQPSPSQGGASFSVSEYGANFAVDESGLVLLDKARKISTERNIPLNAAIDLVAAGKE